MMWSSRSPASTGFAISGTNGGGFGANLEWWLADLDGNPIALFNDDSRGGLKIYCDNIAPTPVR